MVKNDRFYQNGIPINVRSGSVHYSRVPRALWRDRLERAKALGLNAITTYVPWNFHEDVEGRFDFSENRDVYAVRRRSPEIGPVADTASWPIHVR